MREAIGESVSKISNTRFVLESFVVNDPDHWPSTLYRVSEGSAVE